MYSLARFQLHMPITLEVTALRLAATELLIHTQPIVKNKSQALKNDVVNSYLHHHVCHEWGNQLLGGNNLYIVCVIVP